MRREMMNEVAKAIGAEITSVNKNGINKEGILVKNGNVGAIIYPESIKADTVEEAIEEVKRIVEATKGTQERLGREISDFVTDFEQVKAQLRARLYNKAVPAEVKRSAKARGFDDLIIVPYVNVPSEFMGGQAGSFKVEKNHLEAWGVTAKEVIDIALKNTEKEAVVTNMAEMMAKMMGMSLPEQEILLSEYVVNNEAQMYGASAILGKLKYFKEKFPKGFFILPASIHEVIVHPLTGEANEEEKLAMMVEEVNRTTVAPEEVLSNKAYAFI